MNGHLVSVTVGPSEPLLRLTNYLENSLRNLFHALSRVPFSQPPQPPVVRCQRRGHLGIRFEPRRYDFLTVIGALHQLAAIRVADSRNLRRAIVNIVNLDTRLPHPAPSNPAHQQRGINDKMTDNRLLQAVLPEQFPEPLRLR